MDNKNYKSAGVDLSFSDKLTEKILKIVNNNSNPNDLGFFSASTTISEDITVSSSVDGVGTKSRIFKFYGDYFNLGHDIVNHCVNDILPSGAKPLIFLDYLAFSDIDEKHILRVVEGISDACSKVGCSLAGGETAQMGGIYKAGDLEVVGFILGIVDENKKPQKNNINPKDLILAIPSSGLHTNGYSLVRKIFDIDNDPKILDSFVPGTSSSLGDLLTVPHMNYFSLLWDYLDKIKSLSHITGGGIVGNVVRSIPTTVKAIINTDTWNVPPLFQYIQKKGNISDKEMFEVFNMGLGMLLIIDPQYKKLFIDTDQSINEVGQIEIRGENELSVILEGLN
jgi:phosphoribosylformylglycinamidine cyclo-ligase